MPPLAEPEQKRLFPLTLWLQDKYKHFADHREW